MWLLFRVFILIPRNYHDTYWKSISIDILEDRISL